MLENREKLQVSVHNYKIYCSPKGSNKLILLQGMPSMKSNQNLLPARKLKSTRLCYTRFSPNQTRLFMRF